MVGGGFPSPASRGFDSFYSRHGLVVLMGARRVRNAEVVVRFHAGPRVEAAEEIPGSSPVFPRQVEKKKRLPFEGGR